MSDNQTAAPISENEVNEEVTQPAEFDQETFKAVVGLIQRLSAQLDELKEKQKDYKQRIQNIQDNDTQLMAFEDQAKEATLAYKKRKQELMNLPESKEAQAKLKEMNEEARDLQESLTNNLLSYYQMTGVQTFDTQDGKEREFKLNARLLPAK